MDLTEPKPLSRGEVQMIDTLGHSQSMTLQRWAWLIGKTSAPDDVLLEWAQSFSNPPSLELAGARIGFPSYSPERRAIRLVVESPSIDIKLKPVAHTVNPVFELDHAPKNLSSVTLDGQTAFGRRLRMGWCDALDERQYWSCRSQNRCSI